MSDNVATPLAEYDAYVERLELPKALMGGTVAMREAGQTFLPKEPAESEKHWETRRDRTVLFNSYRKTVAYLTGQVFRKDISIQDGAPQAVLDLAENVDNAGNDLTAFCREWFSNAIDQGVCHVLVDMPAAPTDEDGNIIPQSRADEQAANRRPYFALVKGDQVIGWRTATEGGATRLVQVRILEAVEEPDGEYGVKMIRQVRVLEPGSWSVWRETSSTAEGKGGRRGKEAKTWAVYESGTTTMQEIPLVTFMPGDRESTMTARPALEDLAYLNLAHWQSSSDQRNILHFARVPLLFGKMLAQDEDGQVIIGPNRLIHGNADNSDLKVVEHSGSAIEAGRQDLKDNEAQMALYGLQLLMPQTGNVTATESALDSAESDSTLKGWATLFQDSVEGALGYLAEWLGDASASITAQVNTEFRMLDGVDSDAILKAVDSGVLSKRAAFDEFKRRGLLDSGLNWEDVQAEMQVQPSSQLESLRGQFLNRGTGV